MGWNPHVDHNPISIPTQWMSQECSSEEEQEILHGCSKSQRVQGCSIKKVGVHRGAQKQLGCTGVFKKKIKENVKGAVAENYWA